MVASWGFDRALGLFLQAKFFQKDMYIGHWMPEPSQIRYIVRPYSMKTPRILFPSDALLVKRFPQYGYFWNLVFEELYNGIKTKNQKSLESMTNYRGILYQSLFISHELSTHPIHFLTYSHRQATL
ncbi:MAG UNVERIFIED_CONTAM: hypothetical protein LVR29_24310 [Microcystis novacekii LVE1205-3]